MPEASHSQQVAALLGIPCLPRRLEEALTHSSYVNEHPGTRDYERLELLGDAVLGLCVTELLLERVPGATEGKLTRMRSALVSTAALSMFAKSLELRRFVRFGRGASASGDAEQNKVMADVVEAIVAAVYLESGLEAARELTRTIVGPSISADIAERDPKSKLQELVQTGGGPVPQYRTVLVEGPDHDRNFEVEVLVDGAVLGRGRGRTKKQAETEAARRALEAPAAEREEA